MKTLAGLTLLCAILAVGVGCQQTGPPTYTIFASTWIPNIPAGSADQVAQAIEDGTRDLDDRQLASTDVCNLRMDPGVTVNTVTGTKGGLCDVNSRSNLDSATLQAALARSGVCPIAISKIEITAGPGLRLGRAFPAAILEFETAGGDKWTSYGQYSRFTIKRFDRSASPTRCIGEFECVARRSGDGRLLLVEGTFNLPRLDAILPEYIP